MAIEEDDYIATPTVAQCYLGVAREMLRGARHLAEIDPIPSQALTLLCGHICESALKSILSFKGRSEKSLSNPPYRHSILFMWNEVGNLPASPINVQPSWVSQLDRVFNAPYIVRYPIGVHAVVCPDQEAMINGTENLVALAEEIIK